MKQIIQHNIRENIRQTLVSEATALLKVSDCISDEMEQAIRHMYNTKGRIVVTGIGKSAIVAQKLVATLNSTGTNALFMHAADAIHGDLGMIAVEDIVLCISKSGDTPEIKVLVPLIKSFGNTLIAIVSNPDSVLAMQADYTFLIPMESEADPNNLAPTTSTTLQMAMGDAIAVALLSLKGFSQEQFARFHPGGSLGKQLYLRVRDLILRNEKPRVYLTDNLTAIIVEISSKRLGITAVVDDNENLCGVITDGDLRRMLETGQNLPVLKAADIMNVKPKTIAIDNLAIDALAIMRAYSITQLVVLEQHRYKGILHLHDLIREGIL